MFCVKSCAKAAVTLAAAFMVILCDGVVPPRLPLKPENTYPELACALTDGIAPALYQPLAGWIAPPPVTPVVR